MQATLLQARAAKAAFEAYLLKHPNPDVNGYGIGRTAGDGYYVVVTLVNGTGKSAVPLAIDGVPLQTKVTGVVRAL